MKRLYSKSSFLVKGVVFISKFRIRGNIIFSMNGGYIIKSSIYVQGRNNKIILDNGVKIKKCRIVIVGDNCTLLLKGPRHIDNTTFELLDSDCSIIVDQNTGFNRNRILVAGENNKINIGAHCIFAENAEVWASDTHSIVDTMFEKRINLDKPIIIGDRVWIGNRVLIHKGIVIGNDSIIAAGSIVTKDVGQNTLVGGIPASLIKKNVKWDIRRL